MRAYFLGQNVFGLGNGIATLQADWRQQTASAFKNPNRDVRITLTSKREELIKRESRDDEA